MKKITTSAMAIVILIAITLFAIALIVSGGMAWEYATGTQAGWFYLIVALYYNVKKERSAI